VVFNYLFARKMGGTFVLRIEDTDRTRYRRDSVQVILDGLRWLNLEWDEGPDVDALRQLGVGEPEAYAKGGDFGPYVQSQRLERYREVVEELLEAGWAYRCHCTPDRLAAVREEQRAQKLPIMYDRHCRDLPSDAVSADEPHVVRLKVPLEGETVVRDLLRGEVAFDNAELDDQVLLKTDGFPTYHLAVVVDDHGMGITHIFRGDDWIASTPKRLLIYRALGWEPPTYCHVPLVLGQDGKKLGKRHGATSITEFRRQGYLPEALLNYLALLGWAPGSGEEQEVFSRQELIEAFDIEHISRAPAAFSYKKLDWFNGVYIRSLDEEELADRLIPHLQAGGLIPDQVSGDLREMVVAIVPLIQERLKRLSEVVEWTAFMFREIDPPPAEQLTGRKMSPAESLAALERAQALLRQIRPFEAEALETPLRELADDMGFKAGQLFGILRWAVTGQRVSPPLFGSMAILRREVVLQRMDVAISILRQALEEGGGS
jgi:glutamyl-tRNA synthetase